MIEQIRKKHEAYRRFYKDQSLAMSSLTISDVDALFAALDEYHILCQGHVLAQKQWKAELDRAKGKVEEAIDILMPHDTKERMPPDLLFKSKQFLKGGRE